MTKIMGTVLLLASACLNAADQPVVDVRHNFTAAGRDESRAKRFWVFSVAGLAAANTFDVGSSWGKHELNGMLRSQDGTFGPRGTAAKIGLQGVFMATESLFVRHDTRGTRHRLAAWINLAAGAAITAVAARNVGIPRQ